MFIPTLEAVCWRLAGGGPKTVPNYPTPLSGARGDLLQGVSKGHVPGVKAPIFIGGAGAIPKDRLYPASIVVKIVGVSPRYDEWTQPSEEAYGGNYWLHEAMPGTLSDVTYNEEVLSGYLAGKKRPRPQAYTTRVQIDAYSDNTTTAAALLECVYGIFPPRGFLRVSSADGSYFSWDMLYEQFTDLSGISSQVMGQSQAEQRHQYVWTYLVEGYADTTDQQKYAAYIKQFELNSTPQ